MRSQLERRSRGNYGDPAQVFGVEMKVGDDIPVILGNSERAFGKIVRFSPGGTVEFDAPDSAVADLEYLPLQYRYIRAAVDRLGK